MGVIDSGACGTFLKMTEIGQKISQLYFNFILNDFF
nr:MAG TPA: Protein SCAI [Caudoviricetes sp.]